ncbi:MAG TPA: sigma-70 family RNA polymerase sigma factor [Gemmatimonadaceae bacterium]|nr:sigma-70 family RNA polymerase sigma factor [Gemmatimonadaceae bacterium]
MSGPTEAGATTDDVGRIDDVVRRAQQGDVQAFELLYRSHAPAVLTLCRRMLGDEQLARELVQDVFVHAWERLTSFRGQSALATWLHRLAVNVVLEHLRSSKRDALRLIEDPDEEAFGGRAFDGQIDARMDIDSAVAQLPGGARAVFVLHDIQGYSHDEIAQMTGIAPGTARAQLFRARRALTRLLDL